MNVILLFIFAMVVHVRIQGISGILEDFVFLQSGFTIEWQKTI